MSLNIKESIINSIVKIRTNDWNEAKQQIINNFNNINLYNLIDNYEPCNKKLYITRPKMRETMIIFINSLNQFFKQVSYDSYKARDGYNIKLEDISELIEICVKIMVIKQQGG